MLTNGYVALAGGLAVIAAAVVFLTAFELRNFRRGITGISSRQLVIRLIGGLLLLGMLAKLGHGLLSLPQGADSVRSSLIFWADCVVLGWLVIVVAAIDLRYVLKYRQSQRQCEGELAARLEQEVLADRSGQNLDPRDAARD